MSLDFCLYSMIEVYDGNITHNLAPMAREAGIYEALWCPIEYGLEYAKDVITPLKIGLQKLKENPEHYKKFNASNGWGVYEHFVPYVEEVLNACESNPETKIAIRK